MGYLILHPKVLKHSHRHTINVPIDDILIIHILYILLLHVTYYSPNSIIHCQWYKPHGISEFRYLFVRATG